MIENAQVALKKYYGYTSFRTGQEKVITSIMEGRDTLAIMPTGGGKSLCFQIPALLTGGVTLVISPLISLMKDQVDTLVSIGVPAAFINSTLDNRQVEAAIQRTIKGEFKLLYIAPERLESPQFRQLVKSLPLSVLAVDEAHCVSQWGHDFRPSYRSISSLLSELPRRPVVAAFTATATPEVKEDIVRLLALGRPNTFVTGFDRENLSFSVVRGENKLDFILNYIEENGDKSGIIYAATRKETDSLCDILLKKGIPAGRYHAGMSEGDRTASQEAFLYDNIRVMVATNAFGMGIDKSNVRYVLHHNMPKNLEAYYQEAGRAGRDGEPGECVLLFNGQDTMLQKYFIDQSALPPERKENEYRKLQAIVDYCHTPGCLRKYILEYFGEENAPESCGNCSSCNDESQLVDITIEAQKIFSCVARVKERYGAVTVAEILKGSKNKKLLELQMDKLSTYGIMKEYSLKQLKDIINLLIADDYLGLTTGEYPVVRLKQKAVAVLKEGVQVFQKIKKPKEKVVVDDSLFEALRSLRRSISEREKVPPYIVFSDATLREMSSLLPTDSSSLLLIKGVGESKLERYGSQFLAVIRDYAAEHGEITRPGTQHPLEDSNPPKQQDVPSHIVSFNMYKSGIPIKEIVTQRGLSLVTIQDHIMRCGSEGLEIDWNDFIPPEYEALILEKIRELGAEKLRPLKDALPEEIDYMAIKAVLCKHKS